MIWSKEFVQKQQMRIDYMLKNDKYFNLASGLKKY